MSRSRSKEGGEGWQWPSPALLAKLVATLLAAVLLQTTVAPNIRILGAHPDFALVIVVCVALLRGAETGAIFGFLTGGLVAVALLEPLGLGAFVFILIGYFVGRYAETADLSAGFAPLISAFAATVVASLLYALVQSLVERQAPIGFFFGHVLLPSLVLNTLLAGPTYALVRFWLRGAGDLRVARAR